MFFSKSNNARGTRGPSPSRFATCPCLLDSLIIPVIIFDVVLEVLFKLLFVYVVVVLFVVLFVVLRPRHLGVL